MKRLRAASQQISPGCELNASCGLNSELRMSRLAGSLCARSIRNSQFSSYFEINAQLGLIG